MSDPTLPSPRATIGEIAVWSAFDRLVPTADLLGLAHPLNPNSHPFRQIELLAGTIQEFGWRNSVVVSLLSGRIVFGHGRVKAAELLGMESVPVTFQEFASEADEIAVLVADNQLAELSSLDTGIMDQIAKAWDQSGFDAKLAGFDDGALAKLLGRTDQEDDEEIETTGDTSNSGGRSDYLIIGKYKIPLDAAEAKRLQDAVEHYAELNGTSFGFGTHILKALA